MTQRLAIHADNPQGRLISQAIDVVRSGGVIIYPTGCAYAFGFAMGNKKAMERVSKIRQVDAKHNYTLVCHDMSVMGNYVRVSNSQFRLIKACVPGPYTFIMEATKEIPNRLMQQKRKTVGVRIPGHSITQALLAELGEPLMSSSLILPDHDGILTDLDDIYTRLAKHVDLIIDGGFCGDDYTTVIDCVGDEVAVLRYGKGDVSEFGL